MSDYRTPDAALAYTSHAGRMYRIAYALLLSAHDAEDAAAEVFARFLRKMPVFKNAEHEKAWFLRVTVNVCRDMLRRRAVRSYTPLEEIAEITPAEQKDARVLESVLALPEKFRVCVLLHYFEGFRVEEIARILHLSPSAVKMRLSRARDMLKTAL